MSTSPSSASLPLVDAAANGDGCGAACGCAVEARPATLACGAAAATSAAPRVETLIDRFLDEQANPTAVERFAREYDAGQLPQAVGQYQELMPATPPGSGQQYAFDVDLDTCTGCKACVTACRSLNGLDGDEAWRSVGLLVDGASTEAPVQQHVTTACHHCVEPGCLTGCPVDAYHKDPGTGIVAHLDDQCIGCGYCLWTCPYEVPQFDERRGIVRKCDLCADRLADGEAPACVQACPTHAISVRVVDVADAGEREPWPFAAPDPALTTPTTTYRTQRDLSATDPADLHALAPSRAHPALSVMLVLTQLAVGALAVALVVDAPPVSALVALLAAIAGLAASVAHLGRPRYAHRAVIGVAHSWLSREVVAFAAFTGLLGLDVAGRLTGVGDAVAAAAPGPAGPLATTGLSAAAAAAGLAGVACSAMAYAVTGRRWWRLRTTATRFGLTTLACGLAVVLATVTTSAWLTGRDPGASARWLAVALPVIVTLKIAAEASVLRHVGGPASGELARTARLLSGALLRATRWRAGLAALGGFALPAWVALLLNGAHTGGGATAVAAIAAAGALTAGELVERWQFFAAVSARRMPGGMR